MTADAGEKRPHAVNPLPAVFPGVGGFAAGVLGMHTPAQVHVEEFQSRLLDALAQLWEGDGDQVVSLVTINSGTSQRAANLAGGTGFSAVLSEREVRANV